MNGKIWVKSKPGKGSVFSFTIQAECGAKSRESLLSPDIDHENTRLLIIADDFSIQAYFREISRQFRINCDIVSSIKDALVMIRQKGTYGLYIVDWDVPEMGGIALSRLIKKEHAESSIVVMLSSMERMAVETEAKAAGVSGFLQKPLFLSAIADCINNFLAKKEEDHAENEIHNFEGCYILLAEDIEINREIVIALLEPTGLKIDCAKNGAEAVKLFTENPSRYHMILMDLQMPEVDGLEATRRIRALDIPHAKTIPIIAMTANVFREDIENCLAAGMNDHLGKPLNVDEVLVKIREFLPGQNKD
jgi:CheY-like chemotaxis protein